MVTEKGLLDTAKTKATASELAYSSCAGCTGNTKCPELTTAKVAECAPKKLTFETDKTAEARARLSYK